jgi:hypothetical protein
MALEIARLKHDPKEIAALVELLSSASISPSFPWPVQ